ncbi:MAG: alpha/beta fold hydrolase [Planctomycetota bacterium]|nr:MAG: alpha/beta fold hydrolase [Planctomycetota bacterium]
MFSSLDSPRRRAIASNRAACDREPAGRWTRWTWAKFLAAAVSCAPLNSCAATCPAFDPNAEPIVYYTSEDPSTTRSELECAAADGATLGYIAHLTADPKAALVYLHGIESHAGWFNAAADGLCGQGFDVYCLDRRGSGINRENRGFLSGYVDSTELMIADIHAFLEPLHERYEHVYLIGLSWGGKLAPAYALYHPEDVDGLILITPGIVAIVDVSFATKVGIFLGNFFNKTALFHTPIEPQMFTTTPFYLERIIADPLRLHCVTARFFWESHQLDGFLADEIERNRLPILMFLAGKDTIIDSEGNVEFLQRGSQTIFDVITYEEQTHSIQFDATDRFVADAAAWLELRIADQDPG